MLGYTPTSAKASNAVLSVKVNSVPNTTTSLTMAKGTVFTTSVDGTSYQFVTNQSYTIQPNAGVFQFDNVNIFEGTLVTFKYTVDSNDVDWWKGTVESGSGQQGLFPSNYVKDYDQGK